MSVPLVLLALALRADAQCYAHLPDGSVSGITLTTGVRSFLGMPFAKPPLGPRRWQPPEQNDPYGSSVFAAEFFPPSCAEPGADGAVKGNESCLMLNVWAPPESRCSPAKPCPVMQWIYGGGYKAGSASRDGARLAEAHDMVFVSANYRVGVFGFLGADELRSRDVAGRGPGNSTGVYGLQDQREAMNWVQRNIRALGGDPSNVFIFGESAGAGSVSNHLIMEESWGLFVSPLRNLPL